MNRPSVTQFISDKRAEGKSDSQITHMLLDAGWHMDIIHKAMNSELIRSRELKPILTPKLQRYRMRIYSVIVVISLILLVFLAIFI